MAGLIGQKFGRYEILELLGEGGMATVYKAYDTRLEREVAIKVIRRDAFPMEQMEMLLKRFERESKALARLSHSNIVGVVDYGEYEGLPYLVMVYLTGGTLKEKLGKPIPWQEAAQLILPIARALEYVHAHNIINRDIKPANILMTEDGQPMMSDFGLVKLFEDKDSTHLTSSGTGLGTPDYMAPEQWTGEATVQSDLYSLGVVFYEMITGRRPYSADTPAGVLLKQATEPLPLPKNYIPDLPKDVESVLLKTLAKDPKDRYPTVSVFANELQNLLAGRMVSASATKTETLRQQMTGRIQKQLNIPSSSASASASWLIPIVGGIGALFLLFAVGAWLVFSNSGMFATAATASPTQSISTATKISPTETAPPTIAPATESIPTETPVPAEIKDKKNIPMVLIPAGEFTMGSDSSGDIGSRPAHKVDVAPFYIDKYETTNEQYDSCVYAVECRKPKQGGSATRSTYSSNPVYANYPAIYLDWKMANAYCAWRGARLPTEAEWEKAARGTDERVYPWGGGELDCSFANFYGCIGDTAPVDQYEKGKSVYGAYGMSGNVWEWTSSLFDLYPYDATDGREDSIKDGERMARGGSWHAFGGNSGNIRLDTRLKLDAAYAGPYLGVRCALSQTP